MEPDAMDLVAALTVPEMAVRRADVADRPFLRQLYGAGRAAEMVWTGWPTPVAAQFLDDQFRLRDLHYRRAHPRADDLIASVVRDPIGRLLIDRAKPAWHIIDIALLPEAQGRGLGAGLLDRLFECARQSDVKRIVLQVAQDNPRAERLYRRLGFVDHESTDDLGAASHIALVRPIEPLPVS